MEKNGLKGQHIISAQDFDQDLIEQVFACTDEMRLGAAEGKFIDLCRGQMLTCLFYKASTRTSSSFIAAMQRLGGGIIPITQGVEYSSVSKGENLVDTVRTLEMYSDVIVLRSEKKGEAALAASVMKKPLINAGDGVGEHPTQALLDLYTIFDHRHTFEGNITFVGDNKNGRTVHSLARLLKNRPGVRMKFVHPPGLSLPYELAHELVAHQCDFDERESLVDAVRSADVLYVTRVQEEQMTPEEYETYKGSYVIDRAVMDVMKKDAIVMHPLPRVFEIAPEVDADPRAVYFKQVGLGLYVRMALLAMVLGKV